MSESLVTNAGPLDLVEVLDRHAGSGTVCHLDPAKKQELLQVAYFVSLRPEEGRYPRVKLFAPHRDANSGKLCDVALFDKPQPLNPENLRRLAPAFPAYRCALVVGVSGDAMVIRGAMTTTYPRYLMSGTPSLLANTARRAGLRISVDGPGEMRVSESGPMYRLAPV